MYCANFLYGLLKYKDTLGTITLIHIDMYIQNTD